MVLLYSHLSFFFIYSRLEYLDLSSMQGGRFMQFLNLLLNRFKNSCLGFWGEGNLYLLYIFIGPQNFLFQGFFFLLLKRPNLFRYFLLSLQPPYFVLYRINLALDKEFEQLMVWTFIFKQSPYLGSYLFYCLTNKLHFFNQVAIFVLFDKYLWYLFLGFELFF